VTLKSKEETKGTFYIKRPNSFRWEYAGEEEEEETLVVGNSEKVWIYEPELMQVVELESEGSGTFFFTSLLNAMDDLGKNYNAVVVDSTLESYSIRLEPKVAIPQIRQITITVNKENFHVTKTVVDDKYGTRTTVALIGTEYNPEFEENLFIFKLPKGVKVVKPH
ncbi:MAG: outer membrane lipoprotein carrier protein LolA, partial [Deltaproteobacteria bacterium]|nr:outer membrane lipoprotein carrier protein LolA [Deltaproteobacteria bacterium]